MIRGLLVALMNEAVMEADEVRGWFTLSVRLPSNITILKDQWNRTV